MGLYVGESLLFYVHFFELPYYCIFKKKKELKPVYIQGIEEGITLDGARKIENTLYLNMYYSYVAVYMSDLNELCNSQTKEIIPGIVTYPDNCYHTVWFAKCFGNTIYPPENGGRNIYKVEKKKISCINLEIPKNIFTICFYQSELWIISIDGWELYRINQDGKLLEVVNLEENGFCLMNQVHFILLLLKNIYF